MLLGMETLLFSTDCAPSTKQGCSATPSCIFKRPERQQSSLIGDRERVGAVGAVGAAGQRWIVSVRSKQTNKQETNKGE